MKNTRGWIGVSAFILGLIILGFEKFYFKTAFQFAPFIIGFGMGMITTGFKE